LSLTDKLRRSSLLAYLLTYLFTYLCVMMFRCTYRDVRVWRPRWQQRSS